MANTENILTSRDGDLAILTLNAPERLNALSYDMLTALPRLIDGAARDGARALVITGAGCGFCSGAALTGERAGRDLGEVAERYYNPLAQALAESRLPVVTAINGVAAGAGASLALAGDIAVAARSASFMLAFARIGLVPDMASTWLVAKSVGRAKALEMALLGDKLLAPDALAAGLINRIVDDEALMDESLAIARRLAAMPPLTLRMIRRQVRAALDDGFDATLTMERDHQSAAGFTRDHQEGVAAFREKRPAMFIGE
ncbi:enoyl-CoA hydratase/isomerase family protein [Sphingobium sp. AS12]|nr:enoyl-CoA hydratase/isomerase family protein [Sphingobium sp. AS12]